MKDNRMTVHEVCTLMGITPRTLHYYDEIGLLKPAHVTEANYRLYNDIDLSRLQEILFLKEIGFQLKEIKVMLDADLMSRTELLEKQLRLLEAQNSRLISRMELIRAELGAAPADPHMPASKFCALQAQYRREVKARWEHTQAYQTHEARRAQQAIREQIEDTEDAQAFNQAFFTTLAKYADDAPGSPQVQALVARWQQYISDHFYPCDNAMLMNLSALYQEDKRYAESMDKTAGREITPFFCKAIHIYCS